MGIFKDAKVSHLSDEAAKAAAEGRGVFTAMLNSPALRGEMSGSIADWALMIEAVESQGWRLQHWSIGQDHKGRPQAYPLFRRA